MIIHSIEWHKDCLKNHQRSIKEKRAEIECMLAALEKSEKQAEFHELQIQEAEKKGKKSFNGDNFMKKERLNFFS